MHTKKQSVEERVKEIIIELMGVNKKLVTPKTSFINDLAADSLDILELFWKFKNSFDINISDEDTEKIQTVEDIVNYIKERTQNAINP